MYLASLIQASGGAAGMPHGYCYLWNRDLIWLHAIADTLIAAAYITIPVTLVVFIRRRRDLPFSWLFVCFAVFIVACGMTHALGVWSIWHPNWWLLGGVKAVTAAASIPTAYLLGKMVPVGLALPSPRQLEARVAERTRELQEAVRALQASEQRYRLQAKQQAAIAALGLRAASGASLQEVMNDTAATVEEVLGVPLVSVIEHRAASEDLLLRAGAGWDPSLIGSLAVPFTAGTPAAYTIRSRDPVVVSDYAVEQRFTRPLGASDDSIVSSACVVVPGAAGVFGVLAAHTLTQRDFSAEEVSFLQAAANVVATALQNDRAATLLAAREAELRQAQKLEAIGRLAGGVAHDFNNLLTVIGGTAALLRNQLPEASRARTDVETIAAASDRAAGLTRQLLAFSRRQVLQPKVLDVNEIVTGVGRMLGRLIGEDIDVRRVLAADAGLVKADPGQLEQVLMNLAVNARDAMPAGGTLTLETANVELGEGIERETLALDPGEYVMLAVSDTGVGIDPVTQASIFEPFFTTKEAGKGTGLGLSTVYGIVQQSGGAIYVYSEPGAGTTFKVYLPRIRDEQVTRQLPAPAATEAPASAVILLAEDEPNVRRYTERVLRDAGYRVLSSRSGSEAISIAESEPGPIHLLLTDMVMPGMTGPALAHQLKAARPDLAVIQMSGYTDEMVLQTGALRPGVLFLQKPFSPASLLNGVAEALRAG